ncbi:MAG: ABC transporter substrate-binding protein [Pseudomonadota bacterium]
MKRDGMWIGRGEALVVAIALALGLSVFVPAELRAEELKVGMSTALTGPASALGKGMVDGIQAVFDKVNKAGGVNGNTLKLVTLDDGYEPARCAPHMRTLIDTQKVLAVLGNVGTPTAIVSVPIAIEGKTPLFGAFTGAGVLRKSPPDRYIINYRASYEEETAAMVKGFLSAGIKAQEIAFFTQNDGYGDSGYEGAIKALLPHYADARKLAHGRYTRNTVNVEDALATIAEASPKAIIMVGAYKPCAKFIKMAREFFPDAVFANVSFVGSMALLNELGADAEGVIVTQVVPHFEADLSGVKQFREDMKAFGGRTPSFVSLEGYLVGTLFVEALKKAGKAPSRESLVDAFEALKDFDLGIGLKVSYSKQDHQASHTVWPTIIHGGKYAPLAWSELKR